MHGRHRDQAAGNRAPGAVTPVPGPEAGSLTRGAQLRTAARKAGHRSRRQAVPWLAAPVLPLAAIVLHHADAGTPAGAALAIAAAGTVLLPAQRARRAAARGRGATARVLAWRLPAWAALAAAWTAQVSMDGWSHTAALTYAAVWVLPALAWWNRHRIRHHHDAPPAGDPEPEPGAPLAPDELLERLRTRVCGQGQKLPGATVTKLPPVKGGQVFEFALVPGKQSAGDVMSPATVKAIASAAQVPQSRVVAENAPGEVDGEHGPEHLARVTILERRHLHTEIQEFTGPTLDMSTGLFVVGPYQDSELAWNRLFKVDEHGQPMRGCSGITAGAQGSGKSRYAEHQMLEQLASGLFKVFLLDGQGGASIPDLIDYVAWAALWQEEWEECLRAAVRLMVTRTRRQAARRLPCWYATENDPFVHIQIEETHKVLLSPLCLRAVKSLIQEGEKVGMGVVPSTQFPSQVELGASSGAAGANVLRDLASSGNVTLFRTGGRFAQNVLVGDLDISPHRLPKLPGMCHPLGVSLRTAPVRAIRSVKPAEWAGSFPQARFSELDLAALNGGRDVFAQRHHRLTQHAAEPEPGSLDHGSIDREVALMLGEAIPGDHQAGAPVTARATAISEVLKVLRANGSLRRAEVIDAVHEAGFEYSDSAIDDAYATLKRKGAARDGGRGIWELASVSGRAA